MNIPGVRLTACAKINWTLEVTGRRADGYHNIRTVLQTIGLADTVSLNPSTEARFTQEVPSGWSVPDEPENLAGRAVRLYAGRGEHLPTALRLVKRVPPAAGLGGGSSDAAAVLRGLDRLAARPIGRTALEQAGAELGSDVAFFTGGGTQLAGGRGEQLTPLPDAVPCWLVLVTPPIVLAQKTARLYGLMEQRHFSDGSRSEALAQAIGAGAPVVAEALVNGFDAVADRVFAGLGGYRALLSDRCGHALLCGAGPSLFAIAASDADARRAAADLRASGVPATAVRTETAAASTRIESMNQCAEHDILA